MFKLLILSLCCLLLEARPSDLSDDLMHPAIPPDRFRHSALNKENSAKYWDNIALKNLQEIIAKQPNLNIAKNVILFMGDGMSVPTLAATRVYLGGENVQLSFEKFPYTAVSKTYCVDVQVPDSACTSTAYLTGVKGNYQTIGVTGHIRTADCQGMGNTSHHVHSIAQWAQVKGKSTGYVTTARVTHASPAGVFGHTAHRGWEADTDIIKAGQDPAVCADLATQLVTAEVGKNLKVIMGGGRSRFIPEGMVGDEGDKGYRSDGVYLIDKWKRLKEEASAKYIWNRNQLLALDLANTDYVLGLFEDDHCPYHLERDRDLDPTLTEMTSAAIKLLSKDNKGYFLFVEGARIDMAHHVAKPRLAFEEVAEFSRAVELAVNLTSEEDTLIVVTSDHAHTMSITGYPPRGHNIFGILGKADDQLPYTTLNYANGPGYRPPKNGSRHDMSGDDLGDINYRFPGVYPLRSETHGGDVQVHIMFYPKSTDHELQKINKIKKK